MKKLKRRQFISGVIASSAAPLILAQQGWKGANDRVQVACVGLKNRGMQHLQGLQALLQEVQVRALCDVDEQVLAQAQNECRQAGYPQPSTYTDYRKLLEDPDLDAVFLATPNHWHALGTIWACQAGKDVYVEKPVSHNIWEGRRMIEAARQYDRLVQTGFQLRSFGAAREAVRFLRSGGLGEVYMARGICFKRRDTIGKAPDEPVPPGVHYNLWIGPAPKRPFSRNRFHYNWHWQWDYGNGEIGNQAVHQLDMARWGLGLDQHPVRACASGAHVMFDDDQQTPNVLNASFEYPAREGGDDRRKLIHFEVRHWMTNGEAGIGQGREHAIGVIFYGSEGYLAMDIDGSWKTFLGPRDEPGPSARSWGNHFQNFIEAVRTRDREHLNCDVEEGHKSATLAHLANIAYRTGRSIEFDPRRERIIGDREAQALCRRRYRPGFVVPG